MRFSNAECWKCEIDLKNHSRRSVSLRLLMPAMCVYIFSHLFSQMAPHTKKSFSLSPPQPCVCCVCRRILNYSQVELELPCLKRFMLCVCVSSHFKWTSTTMRKFSSLVAPKHRFAAELCYVFQQEWDFSLPKKRHRRYSTATTWKWSTHCKDTWSISKTLLEFRERKKNIVVGTNEQASSNERSEKEIMKICLSKASEKCSGKKAAAASKNQYTQKKNECCEQSQSWILS